MCACVIADDRCGQQAAGHSNRSLQERLHQPRTALLRILRTDQRPEEEGSCRLIAFHIYAPR